MVTPSPNEVHALLTQWADLGRAINSQFDAFYSLTKADIDSPMWAPVFRLWDAYTRSVSSAVGDQSEWLSWFDLENDMGAKGLQVEVDGKKRSVKTLADLVWVLTGAEY